MRSTRKALKKGELPEKYNSERIETKPEKEEPEEPEKEPEKLEAEEQSDDAAKADIRLKKVSFNLTSSPSLPNNLLPPPPHNPTGLLFEGLSYGAS